MHSDVFTYVWLCAAATLMLLPNSLQSFQPTSSRATSRPRSSQPRFKATLIGTRILLIRTFTWFGDSPRAARVSSSSRILSLRNKVASVGPLGSLPFKFGQLFSAEPQHVVRLSCTHWYRCLLYYYRSCFVQPFCHLNWGVMPARGTHWKVPKHLVGGTVPFRPEYILQCLPVRTWNLQHDSSDMA